MKASWVVLTALVASWPMQAFGGDRTCTKLEERAQATASSETELALGQCYERLKRTASAWNAYNTTIEIARRANRPDHERAATARVAALEPWLSRVTVELPEGAATLPGLRVSADGAPLQVWTDVPMDPGNHVIEVTATGKKPVQRNVEVRQSEGLTTAAIPQLEDAMPATDHALVTPEPMPRQGAHSSVAILSLGVGGGLAVLTAAAASIVGGVALGDASAAHAVCPSSTCTNAAAISQNNTALTLADWSTGLFITSGVILVAAVVTFFAIPPPRHAHPVAIHPILSPWAVGLAGSF